MWQSALLRPCHIFPTPPSRLIVAGPVDRVLNNNKFSQGLAPGWTDSIVKLFKLAKGIIIGGPTGIGKTDLAVLLAQRLHGELVSCDSVQVYRGLTIGANKTPTDPIPQHLIDVLDWRDGAAYTAADFWQQCWEKVREVVGRGAVPILVGGTGFYLDWIVRGRPSAPPTDPHVLGTIEEELRGDAGWEASLARLQRVDPEYANAMMANDYYRLKRALVVHRMTGRPLSSFKERTPSPRTGSSAEIEIEMDWRCFYLTTDDRIALLHHIDRRCEEMIRRGLIQEVQQLCKQGFSTNHQAGRAIGYQETLSFLLRVARVDDDAERDRILLEYIKEFQSQTRQYTRRQEKWFHAMPMFRWIRRPSLVEDLPESLVEQVIALYQMERSRFDNVEREGEPLVQECIAFRAARGESSEARKHRQKRLRTYHSVLHLYKTSEQRKNLLDLLH